MLKAAIALAFSPFLLAADRGVPTDVDLRSAFCIGYWKDSGPIDVSVFPPDFQARVAETNQAVAAARQRLQAYLAPKLGYLDTDAVIVAMNQGRAYRQSLPRDVCETKDSDGCRRLFKTADDCRTTPFLPF